MAQEAAAKEGELDPVHTVEEDEYPGGLRLTAIVAALVLSIFLASLDTTIITTAIPSITKDFHSLEDVGWYGSAIFYINLPFGGVAALAMLFAFRAPKAASPTPVTTKEKLLQMDIPGAILICATIVCFTLALRWAGVEKSWKSSDVLGTLVATPVFLVLFGIDQWIQGERALIMPSFLKNRVLLVGAIFEFFIAGCFNLALFYLPIYFQAVRGIAAISSGVRLIPVILGLTITQIAVGGIVTVTGIHNPFLILGPIIAAIGSGLFMLLDEKSNVGRWIGFQIILGVGVGFCLTIPLMLSQVVVKTKDVSIATPLIIYYADDLLTKTLGQPPAGILEETYNIPTSDSYTSTALLTRPAPNLNPGPLIVLIHPGGFFLGSPTKLTMYARPLAQLFNASVLCPSYRFAPEHAFPVGIEDTWETLQWAASHASELGADPGKGFLVGGISSGANFAVVLTRRAVEIGLQPPVTGTWAPIFIGLNEKDAVPDSYKQLWTSHEQHRDALVIDEDKAATMFEYYKPTTTSSLFNPLASPFDSINAMPKIFLQVAGHDLFRDDGLILACALQDQGVEVKLEVYPGVCHSFWVFAPSMTLSKRFVSDIVEGFAWLLGVDVDGLDQGWETAMRMPAMKIDEAPEA
ncbi:MAG: hypothetical protein Q9160_005102 [Pyrenula sp. 1 TL-2023]